MHRSIATAEVPAASNSVTKVDSDMHVQAFEYVQRTIPRLALSPRTVVEIGSRDVNGSVRHLFPGTTYTGLDVLPGPGVDIIADGADWLPADPVDLVLCLETLEHTPHPHRVVANALGMLRPSGGLIVTAATEPRAPHSGIDGGPLRAGEYYGNVDAGALLDLLSGCSSFAVEVERACGDVRSLAFV